MGNKYLLFLNLWLILGLDINLIANNINSSHNSSLFIKSKANTNKQKLLTTDLETLEKNIYLATNFTIDNNLNKLADLLLVESKSSFLHYLLTIHYIEAFKLDPGNYLHIKKAGDLAKQAYDLDNNCEFAAVALASFYSFIGQDQSAIEILGAFIKEKSESITWRSYLTLAKSNFNIGNINTTKVFLNKALDQSNQNNIEVIFDQFYNVLNQSSEFEQKIAELNELRKRFNHNVLKEYIAISYLKNNDLDKALSIYENYPNIYHSNYRVLLNYAILLYQHKNQPHKAISALSAAKNLVPPKDTNTLLNLRLHKGLALIKANNYKDGHNILEELVINHKSDALEFIGTHYSGNPDQQIAFLNNILNKRGSSKAFAMIGNLQTQTKLYSNAIDSFRNAIIIDPQKGEYYSGLGMAYYKTNDFNRAKQQFRISTILSPDDASSHYNLACVLAIQNELQEAITSLTQALTLDPSLIAEANMDQDFINLRSIQQYQDLVSAKIVRAAH